MTRKWRKLAETRNNLVVKRSIKLNQFVEWKKHVHRRFCVNSESEFIVREQTMS